MARHKHVLWFDDDPSSTNHLHRRIEKSGWVIHLVRTAHDFRQVYEDISGPAVVVLDIKLDGVTDLRAVDGPRDVPPMWAGLHVLYSFLVKKKPATPVLRLPVCLFTVYPEDVVVDQADRLGLDMDALRTNDQFRLIEKNFGRDNEFFDWLEAMRERN